MNSAPFMDLHVPFGYECKWSPRKAASAPKGWASAYPDARFEVITPENYLELLT